MIFGAHIYLWIERWSDQSVGLIDHVRELGMGCMEIAVGDDVSFAPKLTRKCAEAAGVKLIVSPGAAWPMECDISDDDPVNRARGLEWHRRQVDLAAEVGAIAYGGAIYGHPGRVQRRLPSGDELPRTAENLNRLAEHAARAGMKLFAEPMSHFRTHMVTTPREAVRLIETAGHPNAYVLIDTYHLLTETRDFAAEVRAAGPRLWGVHACESDRGVPGGGLAPWEAFFSALREVGFDGPMLLESYNSSLRGGAFAFARGMFHDVCPDGDEFARRGLAFLESCRRRAAETPGGPMM